MCMCDAGVSVKKVFECQLPKNASVATFIPDVEQWLEVAEVIT